jgi:hypothetical protein
MSVRPDVRLTRGSDNWPCVPWNGNESRWSWLARVPDAESLTPRGANDSPDGAVLGAGTVASAVGFGSIARVVLDALC